MRPARAVVFDLDGTLVDTRFDIARACNHALTEFGRPPRAVDEVVGFVGDGARTLVARAFGLPKDDPLVAKAYAVFSAYYDAHAAEASTWMPGARDALDACAHLRVALATNKPRSATLPLLEALGLTSRLEVVVAGGDGPLKPDPAAIRAALAPLGVSPEDAWVVGDGPQDVGAGRAAGAWTIGVLGGFASEASLRASAPDRLLGSLADLRPLLAELATASPSASAPSGGRASR